MTVNAGHRTATARHPGRRAASLVAVLSVVVAGMTVTPSAATATPRTAAAESSDVRVGVLALAGAIAAVGRTPELAGTLPFTRTSVADVLRLDDVVTSDLTDALAGSSLAAALGEVRGIRDVTVTDGGDTITFGYAQTQTVPLELAYDDGDLRFGANAGAGDLTCCSEVTTTTHCGAAPVTTGCSAGTATTTST
jgi:hypothetical protein